MENKTLINASEYIIENIFENNEIKLLKDVERTEAIIKDNKDEIIMNTYRDLLYFFNIIDEPTVIALTGYDDCGKHKLAKELNKLIPKSTIIGITDLLKKEASKILNVDLETLEKMKYENRVVKYKDKEMPFRRFLLKLSEDMRNGNDDLFIDEVIARIYALFKSGKYYTFIIPDLKYKREDLGIIMNFSNKYYVVKVNSKDSKCGSDKLRYEVDKLDYNFEVTI